MRVLDKVRPKLLCLSFLFHLHRLRELHDLVGRSGLRMVLTTKGFFSRRRLLG